MPVLWWEEVKVLCSKRCGLWPPTPPPLQPLPSTVSPPSGQTVFMLLDEWKKKRWNFYLLWRFSPRRNSKIELYMFGLEDREKTKDNIQHFWFILFVFATETWAKRASTRLRGGSVSDRYWRDRLQRGNKGMYTVGVRVCARVHVCVLAC